MWGKYVVILIPLVLSNISGCTGSSLPGKPSHLKCRSPEKETFTCHWEPGASGGLPTTHHLYYQKEDTEGKFECPDYQSAGSNSCFFDRKHTSLWVSYNITVVAFNSMGRTESDPFEVDVPYIVQPNAPENVTLKVEKVGGYPNLIVGWNPPHETDIHSGWITLTYLLRIKHEDGQKWEEYIAGKQNRFIIYSLHPSGVFMVQVRSKPDHGFASDWSPIMCAEIPQYHVPVKQIWIVVGIFVAFILLVVMFSLSVKRKYVKRWLVPPVPGPKIRGFDTQLLKSGRSDEILSALFSQGFSPTVDCKDQMVDYLVVFDSDEELIQDECSNSLHLPLKTNGKIDGEERKEMHEDQDDTSIETRKLESRETYTFLTFDLPHHCAEKQNRCDQNEEDLSGKCAIQHIDYLTSVVNSQGNSAEEPEMESTTGTLSSSSTAVGYVDVCKVIQQEPDDRQPNYIKVGGVDTNNVLLLHRERFLSNSTPLREKGNQAEFSNQKPCKLEKIEPTQEWENTGFTINGYVDSFSLKQTL